LLDSKGFDLWANGYDRQVCISDESNEYPFAGYKEILGLIYKMIMENKAKYILDIGFGTAVLTKKLYDDGCNISGIDFSKKMYEIAKAKMKDANLIIADFSNGLPKEVNDKVYNVAICTYAIHHLKSKQKIILIREVMEHLNGKGLFIIGDIMFESKKDMMQARERNANEWDEEEYYIVVDELKREINGIVFEFNRITYCSGIIVMRNT